MKRPPHFYHMFLITLMGMVPFALSGRGARTLSNISFRTGLTASIVAAYVGRNHLPMANVDSMLRSVHQTLSDLDKETGDLDAPLVSGEMPSNIIPSDANRAPKTIAPTDEDAARGFVRDGVRSLYDDHLICLDDGKSVILLERHLRRRGTDMRSYCARWNLPVDYPSVAPGYSEEKRRLALVAGFGRVNDARSRSDATGSDRRRGRASALGVRRGRNGSSNASGAPSGK